MAVEKFSKITESKGIDIPEGTHPARFLSLVHLGVQKTEWQGKTNYKEQVLLRFELSEITLEDGRPVSLTKRENLTLLKSKQGKESNLLKLGKALNGGKDVKEGIDWEDSLGKPLFLEVSKTDKGSAKIEGYVAMPASLAKTLPPLVNEPSLLLDVDTVSEPEFKKLPEWVQKVMNERVNSEGEVDPGVNY